MSFSLNTLTDLLGNAAADSSVHVATASLQHACHWPESMHMGSDYHPFSMCRYNKANPRHKIAFMYIHVTTGHVSGATRQMIREGNRRLLLLDRAGMPVWAPLLHAAPSIWQAPEEVVPSNGGPSQARPRKSRAAQTRPRKSRAAQPKATLFSLPACAAQFVPARRMQSGAPAMSGSPALLCVARHNVCQRP